MIGHTMNLVSKTYHSCEMREYVFMIFRKYIIISPLMGPKVELTKLSIKASQFTCILQAGLTFVFQVKKNLDGKRMRKCIKNGFF